MEPKSVQHVVGLDLDGVIVDHTENRMRFAEQFGFRLARRDTAADIIGTKLPPEVHVAIQRRIYDDPHIALTASLIEGAREGIAWLRDRRMPYHLISRRRNSGVAVELLQRHNLWPAFFNEESSDFVVTPEDKNESAKARGITIYIDDEPDVLRALTAVPHRFLFDPLGVRGESDAYTRLASWDEFRNALEILCRIS